MDKRYGKGLPEKRPTVLQEKIKVVCAEIETLERELSHKRGYLDGLIYAVSELEKGVTSAPEKI